MRRKKAIGEDAIVAGAPMGAMSASDALGTKSPDSGYMGKDNFLLPVRVKTALFRRDLFPRGKKKKNSLLGQVQLVEDGELIGKPKSEEVLSAVQQSFPEATRVEAIAWCPASGKFFAKAASGKDVAFVQLYYRAGKLSGRSQDEALSREAALRKAGSREVKIVWKRRKG